MIVMKSDCLLFTIFPQVVTAFGRRKQPEKNNTYNAYFSPK